MIRRHTAALRLAFAVFDGASAAGLFILVSSARFGLPGWSRAWEAMDLNGPILAVGYAGGWVFGLWINQLYVLRGRWSARAEVADILRASLLMAVATFSLLFVFKLPNVSRLFLLDLFVAQFFLTALARFLMRTIFRTLRSHGRNLQYMLVVGSNETARAFSRRVTRHNELGLKVIGHLATPGATATAGPGPILGTTQDIEAVLHSNVIDEVALCLEEADWSVAETIARLCAEEGIVVRIPLPRDAAVIPGSRTEDFDGIVISSLAYGPDRAIGLLVKRGIDVLGGAAGVILSTPILIVAALCIWADDRGPVFFSQTRLGLRGRPFRLIKLRTMAPDAEAHLEELAALNEVRGQAFKLTNDPRVSRVGRWLRRTSLDELPQFWNVLTGSMSLVGPRPPLPGEVNGYDVWHRRRLSMKPGMTGLWQVSARRQEDFDQWVQIDLGYIDRWSLLLDLKILARTIPAVLSQEGR